MKIIEINNKKYDLITNYKDAFEEEEFNECVRTAILQAHDFKMPH